MLGKVFPQTNGSNNYKHVFAIGFSGERFGDQDLS